jgi:hypothetical protein
LVPDHFFSADNLFSKRLYVLIHLPFHLASGRVSLASSTSEANVAWTIQLARDLEA